MSTALHEVEYYSPDLNPNKYVIRENVPIFREIIDDDGTIYDQRFLEKIVENSKRREDTGDLILLTIGHTQRDVPETQQPKWIGYCTDLKLAKDKKTDDVLVVADLYINKDDADEAFTYQRRSPEIWVDEKYIDIVSLLRQAPKCDLGLLAGQKVSMKSVGSNYAIFKKANVEQTIFEKNNEKDINNSMDKDEIKSLIRECMKEDADSKDDNDNDNDSKDHDEECKSGESKKMDMEGGSLGEVSGVGVDVNYGVPGANNTSVPSDPDLGDGEKKEKKKMEKETESIHANLFAKENESLKVENETLKKQVKKFSRERDMIQLEAEGILLNRAEELEYVEDLSDVQYEKHLGRIKKQYQKLPITKVQVSTESAVDPEAKNRLDPQMTAAVAKFARENQIVDFSTALKRFTAANNGVHVGGV